MGKYSVVVVGSGPGGLFSALTLIEKDPSLKILMIDKGKSLENRDRSKREDLMCGGGGAGAFSDFKQILSVCKTYGGNLQDYIHDLNYFSALMQKVDDTHMRFSPDKNVEIYGDDADKVEAIKLNAARNGITLLTGRTRHFGSDLGYSVLKNMFDYLSDKIEIKFETEMVDFEKAENGKFHIQIKNGGEQEIISDYLIISTGRSGSKWLEELSKKHGLKIVSNKIDVGCRLEFNGYLSKHIDSVLYEPKMVCTTANGLTARSFCFNVLGIVVDEEIKEGNDSVVCVNGHSNRYTKTENSNFSLLVSSTLTEPFSEPNVYGRSIAKLCNALAGGGVLIQSYRDLAMHRRSTAKRIKELNIQPTLKTAEPGDITLGLPYKHVESIMDAIKIFERIMPGLSNDLLIYAPEIKFYSSRMNLNDELETDISNLYGIGDSAGVSRGITQSAMSGMVAANSILNKIAKKQ